MAAVRHRENGFLPLPCPGQAEENYLDAAGADAGRCAGDRWGGGCQWHERWEESSSGPGGRRELLPPPKGRKKPGPTLYGAGRTKRCQKGARQRFRPQGKARAHGLRARAVETTRRGLLPQAALSHCCAPTNLRAAPPPAQGQPARSTAMRAAPKGLARCGR